MYGKNDISQFNDVIIYLEIIVPLQQYAEKHQHKKQESPF